jgi:hypothetical protein
VLVAGAQVLIERQQFCDGHVVLGGERHDRDHTPPESVLQPPQLSAASGLRPEPAEDGTPGDPRAAGSVSRPPTQRGTTTCRRPAQWGKGPMYRAPKLS